MKYIVRCPDGTRYKVRQAVSLRAAINEITHARATGSVGGKSMTTTYVRGVPIDEWPKRIVADVVEINSDGTERQPYSKRY